ncbi:MAG: hypothetical protein ACE5H9_16740 [Anaerolineae bacterium]
MYTATLQELHDVCIVMQVIILCDQVGGPPKQCHLEQKVVVGIAAEGKPAHRLDEDRQCVEPRNKALSGWFTML